MRRRLTVVAAVVGLLALAGLTLPPGAGPSTAAAAPTLEDQVHDIAKDLMCPVCAGQTVADSGSQLAEQMRTEIRQRLQAGQTREEIIAYFIGQFGDSVLARPPARGTGLVLWLALPVALLLGALILRRFVRASVTATEPAAAPPPPTPEEAERIARALRQLDDSR
ncbi:MAG: cytochrome c-type biogenesis protein CcmH [Armatimonadota bacterium]|nr:cytochrome c-type biogenesis protein CcmH [Armatimonadota bacterium]